jgi:hypothetical protein
MTEKEVLKMGSIKQRRLQHCTEMKTSFAKKNIGNQKEERK